MRLFLEIDRGGYLIFGSRASFLGAFVQREKIANARYAGI